MGSDHAQRVMDLYLEACECDAETRTAFLQARCEDDGALREEVEALLRCRAEAGDFLAQPIFHVGAELLADFDDGELRAGERLGDCVVQSLLGIGGMGEVYLAQDTALGRLVAVKLIQRGRGSDLLRHFRHERQVLAGLNHPHIARLYGGAVTPEGRAYLVMEYVEGERLDRYAAQRKLDVAARLVLFRKVCAAVAYAHQNLVVHRDLKPANIRVTPEGDPKLLDFGIAKLIEPEGADTEHTVTMFGAMTPEYASPEQLRGETITTASDVYSLGVVLYELLTGQRAYQFAGNRPDQLTRAICEQDPPRPSTLVGRPGTTPAADATVGGEPPDKLRRLLEGDLDNIVAMAMRKRPERRYASVAQFSEDIRRHCEGLPVLARKDTLAYRTGKFIGRNRVAVVASAAVALALVVGLITAIWQARVARQAQAKAEIAQSQAERLNGFLQVLLGSADPESGPGRDLKVVQVLDQAGENLDRELSGEPALLAQAHLTIGQAYARLQVAEPAIRHLRAAVELGRKTYGDQDIQTARAEAALGRALYNLERKYTEAEPYLHHALAVERRQPVIEPREYALALEYEGRLLGRAHRYDEARSLMMESLSRTRQAYGERSLPYAQSLVQFADIATMTGDYAGSEPPLRQSIAIFRQLGTKGPSFAGTLTGLAYILILQGKLDEPESILQEAENLYRTTVGEKSLEFSLTLGTMGWLHYLRGDYRTAEAELRQSLAYVRPLVPPGEQDLVGGTVTLAMTLIREGKAAEAEPLLRDSLAQATAHHLVGTALPENIEAALGDCLRAQGR